LVSTFSFGGGKGTRTPNPLLAKQVRYQLRHAPRGLIRLYLLLLPKCLELLYVLQQSYKLHLKQRSWQVLEELFSCLLLFWCSGRTKTLTWDLIVISNAL